MARSRKARPRRRPRRAPARPNEAEQRLLALARELSGLGRDALPRTLRALSVAYAPDAPLPRAFARAFLATRADKTGALALSWAREQVRLALQELLEATPPSARGTVGTSPETLAWLLLAGAEALAKEPPAAVSDRLKALAALTGSDAIP